MKHVYTINPSTSLRGASSGRPPTKRGTSKVEGHVKIFGGYRHLKGKPELKGEQLPGCR